MKAGKFDELDGAIRTVLNDCLSATGTRELSPSDARKILTSAVAALDDALKTAPESPDLVQQKSTTLGVLARIEEDSQRVSAIRKDAANLKKQAQALKSGPGKP